MFPSKLIDLQMSPQTKTSQSQIIYWSLPEKSKNQENQTVRPFRDSFRREILDAANQDGEHIMTECNRLLKEMSSHNEVFKHVEITHMKRFSGRLKFFDEAKNYGFIVMDVDGSDIFVYADDLQKTGLPKEFLRTAKHGNLIRLKVNFNCRFEFTCMNYVGKYNQSRKAIDLSYLKMPVGCPL